MAIEDAPGHYTKIGVKEELRGLEHGYDNFGNLADKQLSDLVTYRDAWGAYGKLTVNTDISDLTCASVFQPGASTQVVVRFSSLDPDSAAPKARRVVHGFSVKFRTDEGDWDLVGTNSPVHFIRDPAKFRQLIRALKPDFEMRTRSAEAMWQFFSISPESLHQITILFSDRGVPPSPMHMNGYGGHAFSLVNEKGQLVWVKFHLKTHQGHGRFADSQGYPTQQSYKNALLDAINDGHYPHWTLQVQVMHPSEMEHLAFDPFDLTKVWPHGDFPPIEVGVLELNRCADSSLDNIGDLPFAPSNMVPGIGPSFDEMLLARQGKDDLFPGASRFVSSRRRHHDKADSRERMVAPSGRELAAPHDVEKGIGDDHYAQPRALFTLFKEGQRARLFANIAASMDGVPEHILARQLELFGQVHPQFGAGVCAALDDLDPLF